jgi:hypothetical protein
MNMKKLLIALAIVVGTSVVQAQSTPNIGLGTPPIHSLNWGNVVNNNSTIVDQLFGGTRNLPAGFWTANTASVNQVGGVKLATGVSTGTAENASNKNQPNGYAGLGSNGLIPATLLPAPSANSAGGVRAGTAPAHQWLSSINTDGTLVFSQPTWSDLAGNLSSSQVGAAGTLNNATTGNAATASALASTPGQCPSGQSPTGILPNGTATGCQVVGGGGGSTPIGTQYKIAAYTVAPTSGQAQLGQFQGFTNSTGTSFDAPIVSGQHFASQYLSTDNQGIYRSFGLPECTGGCAVQSDVSDPSSDRVGYFNGLGNYNLAAIPDGTLYTDTRTGGSARFVKNGQNNFGGLPLTPFADVCFVTNFTGGQGCENNLYFVYTAGWNYEAGLGPTSGSYVYENKQNYMQSNAAGDMSADGWAGWTVGLGDHNVHSMYWTERQGTTAGDSEGFVFHQDNVTEGAQPFGQITAKTADAAGGSDLSISCSNDCLYVGNGMHLIDTTTGVTTDTATATRVSVGGPNTFAQFTLSTASLPASVYCTLVNEVDVTPNHGDGTTNHGVPATFAVSCSRPLTSGDVGSLMNLGFPFIENVKINAVNASASPQTVTATLAYSHGGGTPSCLGGAVGQYVVVDSSTSDVASSPSGAHHYVYPEWVVCSGWTANGTAADAHTFLAATLQSGNEVSLDLASVPVAVHLYHGAEVMDSYNASTQRVDFGYVHASDDDGTMAVGDTIINANVQYGWWKMNKLSWVLSNPYATATVNEIGISGAGANNFTYTHLANSATSAPTLWQIDNGLGTFLNAGYTPTSSLFSFGGLNPNVTNHGFDILSIYGNLRLQADPDHGAFNVLSGSWNAINAGFLGSVTIGSNSLGGTCGSLCTLTVNNPANTGIPGSFTQASQYQVPAIYAASGNGSGGAEEIIQMHSVTLGTDWFWNIGQTYNGGYAPGTFSLSTMSGSTATNFFECTAYGGNKCNFNSLSANSASFNSLSINNLVVPTGQFTQGLTVGAGQLSQGGTQQITMEGQGFGNGGGQISFNYADPSPSRFYLSSLTGRADPSNGWYTGELVLSTSDGFNSTSAPTTKMRVSGGSGGSGGCVTILDGDASCIDGALLIAKPTYFGSSSWSLDTSGNATLNTASVSGGASIVYECTVAGTLPAGALTTTASNCGAAVDSGLRVH